jgi:hypothetical protein
MTLPVNLPKSIIITSKNIKRDHLVSMYCSIVAPTSSPLFSSYLWLVPWALCSLNCHLPSIRLSEVIHLSKSVVSLKVFSGVGFNLPFFPLSIVTSQSKTFTESWMPCWLGSSVLIVFASASCKRKNRVSVPWSPYVFSPHRTYLLALKERRKSEESFCACEDLGPVGIFETPIGATKEWLFQLILFFASSLLLHRFFLFTNISTTQRMARALRNALGMTNAG